MSASFFPFPFLISLAHTRNNMERTGFEVRGIMTDYRAASNFAIFTIS
jgi:hypothetical protein